MEIPSEELFRAHVFFGVHPAGFVDDVANCASDYGSDCIEEVERALSEDPEIRKIRGWDKLVKLSCDKAQAQLLDALERNFDKFELHTLRHVMNVPEGMDPVPQLTAESKSTAQEVNDLDLKIELLECEIASCVYMKEQLAEEEDKLTSQLLEYEKCREHLEQLSSSLVEQGVESLPSTVVKVLADTREMELQTRRMHQAMETLQAKENRKDPLNRVVPAYEKAKRAFGSACAQDLTSVLARMTAVN